METPNANKVGNLGDAIVSIGDYAVGEGAERKNQTRLAATHILAGKVQRIRMLGSAAIDLAWVAEGKLGASVTVSNNPWNTTVGVAIAREAGAEVVDINGTPHTLTSKTTTSIAPALRQELIDALSEVEI